MIVQRARVPGSDRLVWVVVGEDHLPVEPIRRYLAYLDDVERSTSSSVSPGPMSRSCLARARRQFEREKATKRARCR